jgi:hypothetical protein
MVRYVFIRHSAEQVVERIERQCANDAEALSLASELALNCEVDIWTDERIVGTVLPRNSSRTA